MYTCYHCFADCVLGLLLLVLELFDLIVRQLPLFALVYLLLMIVFVFGFVNFDS